mmetsp:Transcript_96482/g.167599  ORF Transcript_96482/g.167599 Transcript_96482/m.167599 type:complete len:89 (-) Transcript_96482:967-1233(-)
MQWTVAALNGPPSSCRPAARIMQGNTNACSSNEPEPNIWPASLEGEARWKGKSMVGEINTGLAHRTRHIWLMVIIVKVPLLWVAESST